ncbi:Cyclin-A2-1 [Platanthera guangdongensis]|uniref:Cyclin-A2-1 n=1 Tax=Platanthera guangdongensis TaxID=2320717 RepID=A0ABR2N1A1_9ASPA
MKKQAPAARCYEKTTGPTTRAKTGALVSHGMIVPRPLLQPDKKKRIIGRRKRVDSDENNHAVPSVAVSQNHRREVLRDISELKCERSRNCLNAAKMQITACTQKVKSGQAKDRAVSDHKKPKFTPVASTSSELSNDDGIIRRVEEAWNSDILKAEDNIVSVCMRVSLFTAHVAENVSDRGISFPVAMLEGNKYQKAHVKEDGILFKNQDNISCPGVQDIDSDLSNPRTCSLYASIIHNNLRTAEFIRRPSSNFLETVQRDITQRMRGILIDWLAELSCQRRQVPEPDLHQASALR